MGDPKGEANEFVVFDEVFAIEGTPNVNTNIT